MRAGDGRTGEEQLLELASVLEKPLNKAVEEELVEEFGLCRQTAAIN